MKIYFAGAIRGGREDVALYLELVELLYHYKKEGQPQIRSESAGGDPPKTCGITCKSGHSYLFFGLARALVPAGSPLLVCDIAAGTAPSAFAP